MDIYIMHDKVTGRNFSNAGSGAFTPGSDKQ